MNNTQTNICFAELDFDAQCINVAFKLNTLDEYLILRKNSAMKEQYIYAQKVLTTPVMFADSQFNNLFLQELFVKAINHIQASPAFKIDVERCSIRLIFMQHQISKAKASHLMV